MSPVGSHRDLMIKQFSKYISVGALNTIAGVSVIILCKAVFSFGDITSNLIGYGVGLLLGFLLNRAWTFRYAGNIWWASCRYIVAFLFAYSCNLVVVLALINEAGVNSYLAQTFGVLPYTIVFFLLSKYFVFQQKRQVI